MAYTPHSNIISHSFFELIDTLDVAVPTHQRWPLDEEGKQAKLFGGVSGPPPYPLRTGKSADFPGAHPV